MMKSFMSHHLQQQLFEIFSWNYLWYKWTYLNWMTIQKSIDQCRIQKFALALFWQIFRERNVFYKTIDSKYSKNFRQIDLQTTYTLYIRMNLLWKSQFDEIFSKKSWGKTLQISTPWSTSWKNRKNNVFTK